MATVVGIIPDTDTTGRLVYDSDIPYLGLQLYEKSENDRGTTKYSGLVGVTGFTYNFSLNPPANDGLTFGLTDLLPDTITTIYAVPFSGLTMASMLFASDTTLYLTDNYSRVAVAVADNGCLPATISGLRYNSGYWYAYGSGLNNFGLSPDGVFWKTPASNPYLNTINDIAFDPTGMGVAVGSGDNHSMSILLNNKVWMPVLPSTGIFDRGSNDIPRLVIHAKKWWVFSSDSVASSYNGIEWESSVIGASTPYSADYDSQNDIIMVARANGILTINSNNETTVISYPQSVTQPVSIRFNGTKWILTYDDSVFTVGAGSNPNSFIEDMLFGANLPKNNYCIAVSAPASMNGSLDTLFLQKTGEVDIITSGGTLQSIITLPTTNLLYATPNNNFPYGPERIILGDPNVSGSVPQATQSLVGDTLTFVAERLSSGKIRCPAATAYVTDPLSAFSLKFKTDVYSPKNFTFNTDTDTYQLKILESTNQNPFVFSTTTNQSNESKFNFINDGVLYSQIYQSSQALSVQLDVVTEIFRFFENPEQIPEIDTSIRGDVVQSKFYAGETYYNTNDLYSYSMDDTMSINNFSNVSNPSGVIINGSTSHDVSSLLDAIEVADSHNFKTVKNQLIISANSEIKLNNYSGNPFEDPTIEARFENLVDNAIRGKNATGFLDITERARNELINTVRSHSTIEGLVTTDFAEKDASMDTLRSNFSNIMNTLYSKQAVRQELISLIDNCKIPAIRPDAYTSTSEFEISFDGNVLTFLLDSVIIQEYLVLGGSLSMNMNFDSFNTLFNSIVPSNYIPYVSFELNKSQNVLQLMKNMAQTEYYNIEYPNRKTYLKDLARVSLTRTFYNVLTPISIVQPTVLNDYFYMISQYSNNASLVSRCTDKFMFADPYSGNANTDIQVFYADLFGATGHQYGLGFQVSVESSSIFDDIFKGGPTANVYSAPNPSPNYMLNEYYMASYTNMLNIPLTYTVSDFIAIYSNFFQFVKQNKLIQILNSDYETLLNPVLPILPSRNLIRVINDDLMNTYNTSSLLNKLGGSLTLNKTNIFSDNSIFSDGTSSAKDIIGFLNAGASLASYLGDPSLNTKLFSLIIDELGVNTIVDAILQQAVSNTSLALKFLNRNELSVHIPGVYDGQNYQSQSMAEVIWDNFYKFSNATVTSPISTVPQLLNWANYNNNLQYIVPGAILTIGGVQYPVPIGTYIPLIGVNFGSVIPNETLNAVSIYDPSFNTLFLSFLNKNYKANFPDSSNSGYNNWIPLKSMNGLIPNINFIELLSIARLFSEHTILSQNQYTLDRVSYIAKDILPIASNILSKIDLSFDTIFLPEVEQFITRTFNFNLNNTSSYVNADLDIRYKKYLLSGNIDTDYAAILDTSTTYIPNDNHYVDINTISIRISSYYDQLLATFVKDKFANTGWSQITSITEFINSIVSGNNVALTNYTQSISKLTALKNIYTDPAFISQFNIWSNYHEMYDNTIDSIHRFNTIRAGITGPAPVIPSFNSEFSDFIVSISPYDTDRWVGITGVTLGYSRYNKYWKYREDDIVGFEGGLYKCINTSRVYSITGVPPGGYTQAVAGLDLVFIQGGTGGLTGAVGGNTVVTDYFDSSIGPTGATGHKYYTYPTTVSYTSKEVSPDADIEPILAWEEWHDLPSPIYSGIYPDKPTKGEKYTYNELNYTLKSGDQTFSFKTQNWDPDRSYYFGELVFFSNTVYKCMGGHAINKDVGKGMPPGIAANGDDWSLVSGGNGNFTPSSNGVWSEHINGITLNQDSTLSPSSTETYVHGKTFPELNISNPYISAPVYSPTGIYTIGDLVNYDGKLHVRLANGIIRDQTGATAYAIGIPPASFETVSSDTSWRAYPYIDLTAEGKDIQPYDRTKLYNYGDFVLYNNIPYKYIVIVKNTYGPTIISSETYISERIAFYGVTYTFDTGGTSVDSYQPGYVNPPFEVILTQSDLEAGTTSGSYVNPSDSVTVNYQGGVTFIAGATITSSRTEYIGSTGAPMYNPSINYSYGDLVSSNGEYVFKSLKNNNDKPVPIIRYSIIDNIYWDYIGPTTGPVRVSIPFDATPYSVTTDYNLIYHTSNYGTIHVLYNEGLWRWNFTRGMNYEEVALTGLLQYGLVRGIPPPQPTPFNPWRPIYVTSNINPINGTLIYQYSSTQEYTANDVVGYKGRYFECIAKTFGTSIVDSVGNIEPVQLYIPEKEVSFGRLLRTSTDIRYTENIISTDGVNWEDIDKPKWGAGEIYDEWGTQGFARSLRYGFALGMELTYFALKHDNEAINMVTLGSTNLISNMIKQTYRFSLTTASLLIARATLPSNIHTVFEQLEFVYYSGLYAYVKQQLNLIEPLRGYITRCEDAWKGLHGQLVGEGIRSKYFSPTKVYPSITGEPLFENRFKTSPVALLGDTYPSLSPVGNIDDILFAIGVFKSSTMTNTYFKRNNLSPLPAGIVLTTYPNGVNGFSLENMSDHAYIPHLFSFFLPTCAFYHTVTGERYYDSPGVTYPCVPSDQSNYIYLDISAFENSTKGVALTVPLSTFIGGWCDMESYIEVLNLSISSINTASFSLIGFEKIGEMLNNGLVSNVESLYRQHLLVKTGYDDIMTVPIITRKDRDILALSMSNDWITEPYVYGAPNNTFNGWKSMTSRGVNKPGLAETYLTERRTFDAFPNLFQYKDARNAINVLATMSTSDIVNDSNVVRLIRDSQYISLPGGLTDKSAWLNSTNTTAWYPWGQINDNADFSWSYDTNDTNSNNNANSGYVTSRSPSGVYRNTNYGRPSPRLISDETLFAKQGKHVITTDNWHKTLLPFFLHIKMASEIENPLSMPDKYAEQVKGYFINEAQAVYSKNYSDSIRILLIIVITIVTIIVGALAVFASPFTAGASLVGFASAVATVTLMVVTITLTNIPNRPDLALLVTDPGALLVPPLTSVEGLASRCAVMDALADTLSDDALSSSTKANPLFANIPAPDFRAMTYYKYQYSFDFLRDLEYNLMPVAIANAVVPDDPLANNPFLAGLAFVYGLTVGTSEYRQFCQEIGIYGDDNLKMLDTGVQNIDIMTTVQKMFIGTYEQELFNPSIVSYPKYNRAAVIRINDIIINKVDGTSVSLKEQTSNYTIPTNATTDLSISIRDPGEGFYNIDPDGNRVILRYQLLTGSKLNEYITTTTGTNITGRYLNDSAYPERTSVFGLSEFSSDDSNVFVQIPVQISGIAVRDLIGRLITFNPPVYAARSLTDRERHELLVSDERTASAQVNSVRTFQKAILNTMKSIQYAKSHANAILAITTMSKGSGSLPIKLLTAGISQLASTSSILQTNPLYNSSRTIGTNIDLNSGYNPLYNPSRKPASIKPPGASPTQLYTGINDSHKSLRMALNKQASTLDIIPTSKVSPGSSRLNNVISSFNDTSFAVDNAITNSLSNTNTVGSITEVVTPGGIISKVEFDDLTRGMFSVDEAGDLIPNIGSKFTSSISSVTSIDALTGVSTTTKVYTLTPDVSLGSSIPEIKVKTTIKTVPVVKSATVSTTVNAASGVADDAVGTATDIVRAIEKATPTKIAGVSGSVVRAAPTGGVGTSGLSALKYSNLSDFDALAKPFAMNVIKKLRGNGKVYTPEEFAAACEADPQWPKRVQSTHSDVNIDTTKITGTVDINAPPKGSSVVPKSTPPKTLDAPDGLKPPNPDIPPPPIETTKTLVDIEFSKASSTKPPPIEVPPVKLPDVIPPKLPRGMGFRLPKPSPKITRGVGSRSLAGAGKLPPTGGWAKFATVMKWLDRIGVALSVAMAIVQIVSILKTPPQAIDCGGIKEGRE